jgi:hypothetical protein
MKTLLSILEAQRTEADTLQSEVGEQRAQNHRNYALQPLGNERPGRSQYISPDVFDSVEAKKAVFIETFFSGRQVVRFAPGGRTTPDEAASKTAYCVSVMNRNNGFELLRDGWHDAFVAKRMVLHVDWQQAEERITVSVEGADQQQALALLVQATNGEQVLDIDDSGLTQTPEGALSGDLTAIVDRSMPVITLVQPECFWRDPKAAYINTSSFAGYDREVTRGDLIQEGFDPAQVLGLKQEFRVGRSSEDDSRRSHDQTRKGQYANSGRAREQETVEVHYTYGWLDASTVGDESGSGINLYEVIWCRGEILRRENEAGEMEDAIRIVDEMPFLEWTEHKVSHAEFGLADADVLNHSQRVSSILKRLILDNQQMRNTPRFEALHGAVKNPRDLIDQRIGGVLWTSRMGSVLPLPSPDLSPMTMEVIGMLDRDKESRSGMSSLSKGMNTDALKYQNAADMVERLTNASNQRIMKACRDFAETLLVPLFKRIVRLGQRNDKRMQALKVAGGQVQVVPSQSWSDYESDCEVEVALTSDQGQRRAQTLLMFHEVIKNDPVLVELYGPQQRHALIDAAMEAIGAGDLSNFLMRPDSPEFAQMQQQKQMVAQQQQMLAMKAFELDAAEKTAKAKRDEAEASKVISDIKREERRLQVEAANLAADNLRENDRLRWDKARGAAEIAIERDQQRPVSIHSGG